MAAAYEHVVQTSAAVPEFVVEVDPPPAILTEVSSRPRTHPLLATVAVGFVVVIVVALVATNSAHTTPANTMLDAPMTALAAGGDIDFDAATGSKIAGIGPITKSTTNDADWAPWGLSISGNGIMAEAGGAGALRALNDAGIMQKLSSISSVSGGTWFNSQFGFSKSYYDGVLNSPDLGTWYSSYQNEMSQGLFAAFSGGDGTWENGIRGMFSWDSTPLGQPALNQNRKGNTAADLLFCVTLVGDSLMSDNSTVVQMSASGTDLPYSVPAFWSIPTNGHQDASWHIPQVGDLSNAEWKKKGGWPWDTTTDVASMLPTPAVTKIAAMSSAASGITANPELIAAFEPNSWDTFLSIIGVTTEQDPANGVCTTPGNTCEWPSMMGMDGAFSDNLGFALNVGYMQKKHPGKKLRLMGISSDICDRTTDPTCTLAVKRSAFRSLFADSPYPTTEGWFPGIVPGPNRTIFAESITDAQAVGMQTGFGGQAYVTGTFTTVENKAFGVAAGTTVSLVILHINGPQYLQAQTPAQTQGLTDVAVSTYNSMNAVLSTFAKNDKITSGEAFLYYQNVGA